MKFIIIANVDTNLTRAPHYPFKCKECPFETKRNHDLKRHMKQKHNPERSYMCLDCEKSYEYKSSLARHIKIHNLQNWKKDILQCVKKAFGRYLMWIISYHVRNTFIHVSIVAVIYWYCSLLQPCKMALHSSQDLNFPSPFIRINAQILHWLEYLQCI